MFNFFWSGQNTDVDENEEIPIGEIKFILQEKEHIVKTCEVDPNMSLNEYLRDKLHLTGTKRMCNEGGCGTCVVAITKSGSNQIIAVNSCLVSLFSCHGWKVDTVERIGNPLTEYHPVQKTLANFNGTQCGFCSPGMVMNMYALCKDRKPTMKEVENSFSGNICRCTGYRPILTAFKSLCSDASSDLLGTYPDVEDILLGPPVVQYEVMRNPTPAYQKPLVINFQDKKWIKVFTLNDLLSYLRKLQDKRYMLVAGNTGKGVFELPKSDIFIEINEVQELIKYDVQDNLLIIGASMSLSSTLNLFNEVANINSKFAYLRTMADHIDLIANVPVRNIGTLAGNLMLKYLRREFPSDVFVILETFSAKIVIVDLRGAEITLSMPEFLDYDMKKKVIKCIQLSGLSCNYKYETYKIMPRAQNSHALVNAGILFQLDTQNNVKKARIIYGNINSNFIHASRTEKYLIGKELFINSTLQKAFSILSQELNPEVHPPEPDPEFRKQLAISLLYKAILSFSPSDKLDFKMKSGGKKMVRPISSGIQDYETNESLYPLTKAIPKIEALAQTSGQAEYIDDIGDLPNQLYGKLVLTKAAPNSKITKIDVSKALALNGVVRFFTKEDIPGENNFYPPELTYGARLVEKLFCDVVVEYYHQPVGLIVASNKSVLSEAVDLIKITYISSIKNPLITIEDILKANASEKVVKEKELKPKKKGENIKHKISGKFNIEGQYHFHMETQCCLAVPTEDGLDIYPSSQWMYAVQAGVAQMLKLPLSKINVKVRRCGGAFGSKISRNNQISCAAGLAAWLLRKPVRISLSLKENMEFIGKRFPFFADYEVEVNESGVIQHLTSQLYSDHSTGGNEYLNSNWVFLTLTAYYNADPFDMVYYRTKSDTPANTWLRAPGSAEALGFLESVMDHIAYELNIDPIDIRINNINTQTAVIQYLADLKEWAQIDERKQAIATFNKENRWKKKGISVVPMLFVFIPFGPISVAISIYYVDGSVSISHGGIEIGQGINTKAAQVCAYKLNIPLEKIRVHPSNSFIAANNISTGGSCTSEGVCYGVDQICEELLRRLKPYKKNNTSQTWKELLQTAHDNYVHLTATAQYTPKSPFVNGYPVYGACSSEVEVDILTGQYQITRVDLIEDAGTSLSPFVDIGQVEGAFIMGVGYYTTEKLVFDANGKLLTNNTWTYKPPGAKDIPIDFRIKFPKNNPNPAGVLQSKAIGEPPYCLSVSVPLAIRNAVSYARADSDPSKSKYFFFDGPTTVENTFMNSLNNYQKYTL